MYSFSSRSEIVSELIERDRRDRAVISVNEARESMQAKIAELIELCKQAALMDEKEFCNLSINEIQEALNAHQKKSDGSSVEQDKISETENYNDIAITNKYHNTSEGQSIYIGHSGYFHNKPIKWIVLARKGNDALLISNGILTKSPFNKLEVSEITWKDCSLRQWLNDFYFYEIFSDTERKAVKVSSLDNHVGYKDRNIARSTPDTQDRLFVLSRAELEAYPYAKDNSKLTWHLRDVSSGEGNMTFSNKGELHECTVTDGVRPAMWIDLSLL